MSKRKGLSYEGKDLETMSFADNYYKWIVSIFRPYIGKKFVEVGSGSGTFSRVLMTLKPHSLTLIEPSDEMFPLLKEQAKLAPKKTTVFVHNNFLSNIAQKVKSSKSDSFFYINVLEHVEDDQKELEIVFDSLEKGGRLFVLVPAMNSLMSDFDRKIGHYRRYSKKELQQKAKKAGFEIIQTQYLDTFGILPWWLKFTLLDSTRMQPSLIKTYDSLFVPMIRSIESFLKPPIGKNVLLIAQKPK